jgi:tRNA-binding protein
VPTFDDFTALGIRVATVTRVERNEGARDPAYKLWLDLGGEERQTSAKLTELYSEADLVGRQVVAVTGFEPIRVGGFRSDVLVLGVETDDGVVLIHPEQAVQPGAPVS